MKIICVDDESLVLQLTESLCRELDQKPEVKGFETASEALEYLRSNKADLALLDINMPDMNGLILSAEIKKLHPDMAIIFLTGYSQYAVDAFAMHANGYLLKPVSKERLASEIDYVMADRNPKAPAHIEAKTFGEFDLFVDGKPVSFERAKAKELLAYLIDRQGGSVTRANVFSVLWEEGEYDRPKQKQLDVIIRSLKSTLDEYGISEILEMDRGNLRVAADKIDCDMFRFLKGDIDAVQAYRGEYMTDYEWADITEAYMDRSL